MYSFRALMNHFRAQPSTNQPVA